ncbi:MAG: hypothetical protein FJ090_22050, partial [Deltaproteobacteria bacterium]|nr:hypothetical protein [Deltaproteobacteria bacterium]
MILLLYSCDVVQGVSNSTTAASTSALPSCATAVESPPARGCISGTLACGATVQGTTLGGDSAWDDTFYSKAFCFPAGDRHSGSERVYLLDLPALTEATVTLKSDCVDLDLVGVAWAYDGTGCPAVGHAIPECEGDNKRGGGQVKLQAFNARSYLVGIDGKAGAVGPYTVSVTCAKI